MRPFRLFTVEQSGTVTVLRLRSTRLLDPIVSHQLTEELLAFTSTYRPTQLIISFANVKRFSSDIINMLLMVRDQAEQVSSHLTLCELQPEVLNVLSFFQLGLPLAGSLAEALERCESPSEEPCHSEAVTPASDQSSWWG